MSRCPLPISGHDGVFRCRDGLGRRRRWSDEEKRQIVAQTLVPGFRSLKLPGVGELLVCVRPSPYEGEFRGGLRHGPATVTWSDGKRYEGEYRGGKRHGRETYTFPDGNAETCEWRKGERVSGTTLGVGAVG